MERFVSLFPQIQVKTKKYKIKKQKKVFTRNETLFSPNSSTDLRSDAHQSQIVGGDASEDHTQIARGDAVKLLGGIYPPIPPGFLAPLAKMFFSLFNNIKAFV